MAQYRKDLQIIDDSPQRYEMVMLADKWGNQTSDNKSTIIDAFGRQRVSIPHTLFDSQHRYSINDKFSSYVSSSSGATGFMGATGSGSSYINHHSNESSVDLKIGTGSGDYVIRESKNIFPYQPGKSLLVMNTFVMNLQKTNVRQRVGYFGDKNGIYFENDGTGNYLVLRTYSGGIVGSSSGTIYNKRIAQSDWNVDKFNGTGDSLRTLDISKANILFLDIEWLGVGDVRVGFVVDGIMRVAHIFHNDNVNTTAYMTTACLPIRYEIENTGVSASASTMKQICSTVLSEGGYNMLGTSYSISRGVTGYQTLSDAGTFYPTVSIRLNSSYLDQIVALTELSILLESNTNLQFKILLNPTINATTWTASSSGRIDYNIDATTLSGGTELRSGFVSSSNAVISLDSDLKIQLGRTVDDSTRSITGTSDILTIAVTSFTATKKIATLLGWSEII
jgi:hypothetical protein